MRVFALGARKESLSVSCIYRLFIYCGDAFRVLHFALSEPSTPWPGLIVFNALHVARYNIKFAAAAIGHGKNEHMDFILHALANTVIVRHV